MNERIKELKNLTLDKHFSYTWTTMDYDDVSRFAEKFAELLIKECAGACLHDDWEDPRWGRFYANKIKQYFDQ
jgi:hypothetical protein